MKTLIEELRGYKCKLPRESMDDHAADALRYFFMLGGVQKVYTRRKPWYFWVILGVLGAVAVLVIFSLFR
jgi:hypothetical protein